MNCERCGKRLSSKERFDATGYCDKCTAEMDAYYDEADEREEIAELFDEWDFTAEL